MSKSLWSDVLEGTFDSAEETGKEYEAEVESFVTDAPETMVEYVAGCTEGMLAVETVVATLEGRCAVQYLRGEKEQATATMEGVLSDAWETLKEWVKKAYAAIKKFVKKAWDKMKGYISVFKAMVTKYNYVLKSKKVSIKVDWVDIDMAKGAAEVKKILAEVEKNPKTDNQKFHKDLEDAFFGSNGRTPQPKDWSTVAAEAIRVADDGFDKVYSEAFKVGELTERDLLKEINDTANKERGKVDDSKRLSDATKDERTTNINALARKKTNVVRTYTAMVNTAASLKVRLAVKACRAAIRAQAENSSATYGAESSDFSAVMAEVM